MKPTEHEDIVRTVAGPAMMIDSGYEDGGATGEEVWALPPYPGAPHRTITITATYYPAPDLIFYTVRCAHCTLASPNFTLIGDCLDWAISAGLWADGEREQGACFHCFIRGPLDQREALKESAAAAPGAS